MLEKCSIIGLCIPVFLSYDTDLLYSWGYPVSLSSLGWPPTWQPASACTVLGLQACATTTSSLALLSNLQELLLLFCGNVKKRHKKINIYKSHHALFCHAGERMQSLIEAKHAFYHWVTLAPHYLCFLLGRMLWTFPSLDRLINKWICKSLYSHVPMLALYHNSRMQSAAGQVYSFIH